MFLFLFLLLVEWANDNVYGFLAEQTIQTQK